MPSTVSVIIPCYNQAQFLADAITGAIEQDYPHKEIIVVNDGSPDNTAEVAAKFKDTIVYIEQDNKGLSGARNAGITAARGDYIAFLDSDDIYLSGALTVQAQFLDSNSDAALVCGDAILFNDEQGILGLKSGVTGRPKHPDNFRWETVEYCATPSTVMLRAQCFERVGLFDETLKNAAEDWLMWVQLSRHYKMTYLDQPLIWYRIHGDNATRSVARINTGNRYAAARVVESEYFLKYPAHFRAKLLFYRFATAWRVEPKRDAMQFFLRAVRTDLTQLPYGISVIRQGIRNTLGRLRGM